jgi:hypothetical protein
MTATQHDGGPRPGLGALLMLMGTGAQALSYWSPNLGSRFGITWVLMAVGFVLMMRAAFARIRRGRAVAGVLPVAAVVVVCAGTLLFARTVAAPTSGAEAAVDDGERAAQQLRTIIEPQLDLIEAAAVGPEMLASWKSASAQALPLKPRFVAAAEASRLLAARTTGDQKRHHEIDVDYFTLCTQWVDLYEEVHRAFQQESIAEAPTEWSQRLTEIVHKIQNLPPDPLAGS